MNGTCMCLGWILCVTVSALHFIYSIGKIYHITHMYHTLFSVLYVGYRCWIYTLPIFNYGLDTSNLFILCFYFAFMFRMTFVHAYLFIQSWVKMRQFKLNKDIK